MAAPQFHLQFDPPRVHELASRYDYGDNDRIEAIGRAARARGHYTKTQFNKVCYWKSPRSASRAKRDNSAAAVEEITRVALAATSEELRIWAPQALAWVSWPTASVLLHFGHTDPYPILDYRALESLGVAQPAAYTMTFWLEYLAYTRRLAQDLGVDMRTLDRALWQWSKEGGKPTADRAVRVRQRTAPRPGGSKSERMRHLFAQGMSVSEVARELGVSHGFAYGVRKRWLEKGGDGRP